MHFPHPIEIKARRRRITIIVSAVVLVIGLVIYGNIPNEPSYEGRYLSEWLQDCSMPFMGDVNLHELQGGYFGERMQASHRAVRAIGTNAIPVLLEMLEAKDSGFKKVWLVVGRRQYSPYFARTDEARHQMAKMGFMILQTNALPAVPRLVELTKNPDPAMRMRALEALVLIEAADFKALVPVVVPFGRDPDPDNRERAAHYVEMFASVLSNDELKQAGVYETFPEFRPTETR